MLLLVLVVMQVDLFYELQIKKENPTLIQEQNSYAGITNKLLAKKAKKFVLLMKDMEKYFPKR